MACREPCWMEEGKINSPSWSQLLEPTVTNMSITRGYACYIHVNNNFHMARPYTHNIPHFNQSNTIKYKHNMLPTTHKLAPSQVN